MHVSMRMLVFVYMCVCMYIVYLILWCVSSCCSFIILISIVITKFLQLFNKNQSCNNSYLLVFRRRLHALSLFFSFSLSHSISRSLLSSSRKKKLLRALITLIVVRQSQIAEHCRIFMEGSSQLLYRFSISLN